MKSMEFIQSIDWPKWGFARRMPPIVASSGLRRVPARVSNRSRHARYWTEISAVFPHRCGLERPGEGFPALRPGYAQGQVARGLLLAEGLHLRVPDRDRGV